MLRLKADTQGILLSDIEEDKALSSSKETASQKFQYSTGSTRHDIRIPSCEARELLAKRMAIVEHRISSKTNCSLILMLSIGIPRTSRSCSGCKAMCGHMQTADVQPTASPLETSKPVRRKGTKSILHRTEPVTLGVALVQKTNSSGVSKLIAD
jgi:hypothetical protein